MNRLNTKFVNWFVPRDYDAYFEKVKQLAPSPDIVELFKVWKNAGLLDKDGRRRRAFETWERWLKLPRRP